MAFLNSAKQWLLDARTIMLMSLSIAIAFAVGHDRYYHRLDQQDSDLEYLDQHLNLAIGNAFATIVKAALGAAITTAYAQVLWATLRKKRMTITKIDSLSTLTSSALQLLDVSLIAQYPLLVFLAIVAISISVATIFPPGTLAVVVTMKSNTSLTNVSLLDWTTEKVADPQLTSNITNQTSGQLLGIITAPVTVAASLSSYASLYGEIPPIGGAIVNSSYDQTFYGPALSCVTKPYTQQGTLWCRVDNGHGGFFNASGTVYYSAWFSWRQLLNGSVLDESPGFEYFDITDAYVPMWDQVESNSTYYIDCDQLRSGQSNRTVAFDVAAAPSLHIAAMKTDYGFESGASPLWEVTSCELQNASYQAHFNFSNGQQNITVNRGAPEPLLDLNLFNQSYDVSHPTEQIPQRVLGYYAMLMLLGQVVSGFVDGLSTDAPIPLILNSRMAYSDELQDMNQTYGSADLAPTLISSGGLFSGTKGSTGSLVSQLEDFFQNLTVAVMTSNNIAGSAPVNMTILRPVAIYMYNQTHLWLSYGIGIAITALIVCLGMVTITRNGAPYSNKYSTFLRTTPWEEIKQLPDDHTDAGADPLPQEIAASMVMLGGAETQQNVEMTRRRGHYSQIENEDTQLKRPHSSVQEHTSLS